MIIGDVACVRVARRVPASSSRRSEHPAHVRAPPAGARRATLASQMDPCREKTTRLFQVSLARNANGVG